MPGSPAADAAPTGPAADQRGVSRPQGSAFDIGAFELQQAPPDTTAPTIVLTTPANGATYTLSQVVNANYACQDEAGGSGLASCVGTVPNGSPIDTGSLGAKTFTVNAADNAGNTASASAGYTVIAVVDACTTAPSLDTFDRPNGSLGPNWGGLTQQAFFRINGNRLDVQAGGAVFWNPASFGTNQAAYVTLNTIDSSSFSQGVLLKVQDGSVPNAGAVAVVYDALRQPCASRPSAWLPATGRTMATRPSRSATATS